MNILLIILGTLSFVAGIIITLVINNNRHYGASIKWKPLIISIIGFVLFVLGFSFKIVPTGYVGIKTTFGLISNKNLPQGFNLQIPFVQSTSLVNTKQQDIQISDTVWGESKEKTPVYAKDIIVTYQISKNKAAWIYTNVSDLDENLIDVNLVASAIKSSMVEFDVNSVTVRNKIEPIVKDKLAESLNEKYGDKTISVLKIVINNMDFEDSYNDAIAAKSIAKQKQEQQKIENETAIAKAEADKTVAKTNAEAKAETKRITAQAQADANAIVKKSLTDQVLISRFYDKWDGKLPTVMGDGSVITDIAPTEETSEK